MHVEDVGARHAVVEREEECPRGRAIANSEVVDRDHMQRLAASSRVEQEHGIRLRRVRAAVTIFRELWIPVVVLVARQRIGDREQVAHDAAIRILTTPVDVIAIEAARAVLGHDGEEGLRRLIAPE